MMHRLRKGIESSPENADSLEINRMGPSRKNFDIPNEEEMRLIKKLIKGMADLRS